MKLSILAAEELTVNGMRVLVDKHGNEVGTVTDEAAEYLSRVLTNYAPLLVAVTDALTWIQLNASGQPHITRELRATLDNALGDEEG